MTDLASLILDHLRRSDPAMAGDIAFELQVEREAVAATLDELRRQRRVMRHGLHWWLTSGERCDQKVET